MHVIFIFIFRALLLNTGEEGEEGFVESVAKHLVDKFVREKSSQGAQLLRGLSVLCECQGAPIQQNQGKISTIISPCRFSLMLMIV